MKNFVLLYERKERMIYIMENKECNILYHGGVDIIKKPLLERSVRRVDFGKGFYLTSNFEQANDWAERRKQTTGAYDSGIVNKYSLKDISGLKILSFPGATEEWLDFVTKCRAGYDDFQYDIIVGPVADDTVHKVLNLYESGDYTKDEALRRLKIEKTYDQYAFKSEQSLRRLEYIEHIISKSHYEKKVHLKQLQRGDKDDPERRI